MGSTKNYIKIKKALEPLKAFENYFSEYDENLAKSVLINFFKCMKNIKPDKKFEIGGRHSYYSFYINMIPIMYALHESKYARACCEILTLEHNEPFLQPRIYSGLMLLYHEYLE